jgi:hypothetical protein
MYCTYLLFSSLLLIVCTELFCHVHLILQCGYWNLATNEKKVEDRRVSANIGHFSP